MKKVYCVNYSLEGHSVNCVHICINFITLKKYIYIRFMSCFSHFITIMTISYMSKYANML